MQLLDPGFLARFPQRVINVHPALLPAFPGIGAVEQAVAHGVKVFGVTVHFVDEGVDTGPIIAQRAIELPGAPSAEAVRAALRPVEHDLLTGVVALIARGARRRRSRRPAPRRGAAMTRRRRNPCARDAPRRGASSAGRLYRAAEMTQPGDVRVRRALLSVSDKRGVVDFARGLADLGVELVSTGGTARELAEAGLEVRAIEDFTGFPEIMGGRVKTLHPKLYAGLLALRDDPDHMLAAEQHGVEFVDLVCVNLYPFERTAARRGATEHEVDREHRHRRADDDPRGGEELRVLGGRDPARDRTTRCCRSSRTPRGSCRSARASRSRPRRSPTRRATTPRSRAGSPRSRTTSRR